MHGNPVGKLSSALILIGYFILFMPLVLVGVHGPYFLNKRLFPNMVFTLNMEMILKSEIVLINSVN